MKDEAGPLLECLGAAVLPALLAGPPCLPDFSNPPPPALDLGPLARLAPQEAQVPVAEVVDRLAGDQPEEVRAALGRYLAAVPGLVRQASGARAPLLPRRVPSFQPG